MDQVKRGSKTFKEVEIPATEHAKALAKEKSSKNQMKKAEKITIENGKVLKVIVKENGNVYHTYIGREKSVSKEELNLWKKNGEFIYPNQVDQFKEEFLSSLKK